MTKEQPDGGPAFAHGNPEQGGDPGMSLRDWFAGQALIGLLSNPRLRRSSLENGYDPEYCALASYAQADAMLAQRKDVGNE